MADKLPKTYDAATLERIVHNLEKRIDALQRPKLRRIKSVAAEAAQNLSVNEPGYTLDDTGQFFDLVVRAEDSRLYRISGQASAVSATPSSPAGVFVLKSGDTMTGLLILSGDPATALGAATKQYADTKVADTGDTMTGALVIDGSADAIQLRVQGHSAQSANIFEIEDSGANDQVTIDTNGAAVFNEEGNAANFRVESDTDANCLHVNGTNNTVQVGASSASDSAKFYVSGKISASGEVEINGDLNHDGSNVGFYGVTPAARPSAYTQNYNTASRTHAARTASTLTDNSAGTANTTIEALPDPADTPLTADILRDDLVTNLIPALRNNIADLAAQINALKADGDNTAQVLNSSIDDRQLDGLAQ